jgi:hypothetical protein
MTRPLAHTLATGPRDDRQLRHNQTTPTTPNNQNTFTAPASNQANIQGTVPGHPAQTAARCSKPTWSASRLKTSNQELTKLGVKFHPPNAGRTDTYVSADGMLCGLYRRADASRISGASWTASSEFHHEMKFSDAQTAPGQK